jgi:UDP-glucose 4-epimerase
MRAFVTGSFHRQLFVDRLLADGHDVVAYDNFPQASASFFRRQPPIRIFTLIEGDLLDADLLTAAPRRRHRLSPGGQCRRAIRHGASPQGSRAEPIATFNVLEAMRGECGVKRIAFSSTSSVTGSRRVSDAGRVPHFVADIALRASKLAGEDCAAWREASLQKDASSASDVDPRRTTRHIADSSFYRRRADPTRLRVLGDGNQRKSYLYIGDCLDAMLLAMERTRGEVQVFNLGTDHYCRVVDSIGWISERLGLAPTLEFSGGDRGWIGDNPFIFLDCSKIRRLGWTPRLTIREGVWRTLDYLRANPAPGARVRIAAVVGISVRSSRHVRRRRVTGDS